MERPLSTETGGWFCLPERDGETGPPIPLAESQALKPCCVVCLSSHFHFYTTMLCNKVMCSFTVEVHTNHKYLGVYSLSLFALHVPR